MHALAAPMRAPPVARARLGQQHIRRRCVAVAAAAGDSRMLTLHLSDTTLSLPFDPVCAQRLEDALKALLAEFAAKETWERPRRLALMEFAGGDLTVVCNPNAYPTAFQAKALITFQSHGVQVTGEGGLSALRQDVEAFQRGGTA